jgi:hypothetical protein
MAFKFQPPPKLRIVKVDSTDSQEGDNLDEIFVQFNPPEVNIKLGANWKAFDILGLSHQPLQYTQTKNLHLDFTLTFLAQPEHGDIIDRNLAKLKFLQSLVYPKRGQQDILNSGPHRVLLVWPKFMSLTCVVNDIDIKIMRFSNDMRPSVFEVRLSLQEIRDFRLSSSEAQKQGFQRSPGASTDAKSTSGASNPKPKVN